MSRAELYAPVALCAVICVWYYWRVALRSAAARKGAQAGLLLGSDRPALFTLSSAHCCCPSLGLFHLLFVPKDRRWWRPVLLLRARLRWLPPCNSRLCYRGGKAISEGGTQRAPPVGTSNSFTPPEFDMTNGLVDAIPPALASIVLLALLLLCLVAILLRSVQGLMQGRLAACSLPLRHLANADWPISALPWS